MKELGLTFVKALGSSKVISESENCEFKEVPSLSKALTKAGDLQAKDCSSQFDTQHKGNASQAENADRALKRLNINVLPSVQARS